MVEVKIKKNLDDEVKSLEKKLNELIKKNSPQKEKDNSEKKLDKKEDLKKETIENELPVEENNSRDFTSSSLMTSQNISLGPEGLGFANSRAGLQNTQNLEKNLQFVETASGEKKQEALYSEARNSYESSDNNRKLVQNVPDNNPLTRSIVTSNSSGQMRGSRVVENSSGDSEDNLEGTTKYAPVQISTTNTLPWERPSDRFKKYTG
jgi:hypothetical protein